MKSYSIPLPASAPAWQAGRALTRRPTVEMAAAMGLLLAAISISLFACWRLAPGSPHFDEADFVAMSRAILQKGIPEIRPGDTSVVFRNSLTQSGYPAYYGLWHPPAYVYSLAAHSYVFGDSIAALRSFGLLTLIGALGGALLLLSHPPRDYGVYWACTLLLIANPYTVHSVMFLDIDNTLLMAGCILYLALFWWLVKTEAIASFYGRLIASLCFGMLLWVKLTTPLGIVVCGSLLLWHERGRPGLVEAVAVFGAGTALFALSWLAAGRLLRLPVEFPFAFTILGKSGRLGFGKGFVSIPVAVYYQAAWATVPFILLLAHGIFSRWRRGFRFENEDWLWLFVLGVLAFYVLWIPTPDKYTAPYLPVATVLLAPAFSKTMRALVRKSPLRLAALLIAAFALYALLPHPLLSAPAERSLHRVVASIGMALPVVAIALGLWVQRMRFSNALLVSSCVALIPAYTTELWKTCQPPASAYHVVDGAGLNEALNILGRDVRAADYVLCPKAIAWRLPRGSAIPLDQQEIFPLQDAEDLAKVIGSYKVQWIVDPCTKMVASDEVQSILAREFNLVSQCGRYNIFRRVAHEP